MHEAASKKGMAWSVNGYSRDSEIIGLLAIISIESQFGKAAASIAFPNQLKSVSGNHNRLYAVSSSVRVAHPSHVRSKFIYTVGPS
jgi:hypothetical protein